MRKRAGFGTQSDFYCTLCGNKGLSVTRYTQRESGHIKDLYCIHCQRETHHVEIRPDSPYTLETFRMEYEYGNFDEEGARITPSWKQFIAEREQEIELLEELLGNND